MKGASHGLRTAFPPRSRAGPLRRRLRPPPRRLREKDWDRTSGTPISSRARPGFRELRDQIIARARPAAGERVLDVGTGTGLLALPLAQRCAGVWAIDISPAMVEHLRWVVVGRRLDQPLPARGLGGQPAARGRVGRPRRLQLLLPPPRRGRQAAQPEEVYRVLAPGGRLVFGDMMFGWSPVAGRNRASSSPRCASMARRGPAGLARIARNGFKVMTRPASARRRPSGGAGRSRTPASPGLGRVPAARGRDRGGQQAAMSAARAGVRPAGRTILRRRLSAVALLVAAAAVLRGGARRSAAARTRPGAPRRPAVVRARARRPGAGERPRSAPSPGRGRGRRCWRRCRRGAPSHERRGDDPPRVDRSRRRGGDRGRGPRRRRHRDRPRAPGRRQHRGAAGQAGAAGQLRDRLAGDAARLSRQAHRPARAAAPRRPQPAARPDRSPPTARRSGATRAGASSAAPTAAARRAASASTRARSGPSPARRRRAARPDRRPSPRPSTGRSSAATRCWPGSPSRPARTRPGRPPAGRDRAHQLGRARARPHRRRAGRVRVNEPLAGVRVTWSKEEFESTWRALGSRALAA